MADWAVHASRILRAERVLSGVSYPALRRRLEDIGVVETDFSLRNKFSRGTFSFIFFLQCMHVMGRRTLDVTINEVPIAKEKKKRVNVGKPKAEKAGDGEHPT